jgi:hypothetical protein
MKTNCYKIKLTMLTAAIVLFPVFAALPLQAQKLMQSTAISNNEVGFISYHYFRSLPTISQLTHLSTNGAS